MWTGLTNLALALYTRAQIQLKKQEGQTLVEYALIIALVSIGSIAALTALSGGINGAFKTIEEAL